MPDPASCDCEKFSKDALIAKAIIEKRESDGCGVRPRCMTKPTTPRGYIKFFHICRHLCRVTSSTRPCNESESKVRY